MIEFAALFCGSLLLYCVSKLAYELCIENHQNNNEEEMKNVT